MMQDNVKVAVTFRNNADQTALPIRRWVSFLPGQGLGGSFVHWNGQSFRFQVADFIYKTHIEQRYGKKFLEACGPELRTSTTSCSGAQRFTPAGLARADMKRRPQLDFGQFSRNRIPGTMAASGGL
jgi:hypothetical protein